MLAWFICGAVRSQFRRCLARVRVFFLTEFTVRTDRIRMSSKEFQAKASAPYSGATGKCAGTREGGTCHIWQVPPPTPHGLSTTHVRRHGEPTSPSTSERQSKYIKQLYGQKRKKPLQNFARSHHLFFRRPAKIEPEMVSPTHTPLHEAR